MRTKRRSRTIFSMLPAFLALFASLAFAQEMTERHIPLGAYPYLKSEYLAAGTIVNVDGEARTLILDIDGGERSYRLTASTKIWLDRSRFGRTTLDGTLSDLAAGLKAEVRSLGPERRDVAHWVKVQIAPP